MAGGCSTTAGLAQGENHRQGAQFAAQRIEREAERFQRKGTQQDAVAVLAKDAVGAADAVAPLEQSDPFLARDLHHLCGNIAGRT
jgi:hypothetical protein